MYCLYTKGIDTMKIDRLIGIITVLLQNDRISAPYLADKFEVSRRTISRDIDTLCQAGIPVITHQGTGGGISIANGFKLDKSILTVGELSGIVAALKGLGSVSEQAQVERVLDKLGANTDAIISLPGPVVIDLASHYKGTLTTKIEQIKKAILNTQTIAFDYFYEKGESRRTIEPYIVVFQWTSWYVFGFCVERKDWRMFKLNRLWNLTVCEEFFTTQTIPADKKDFNNHFTDNFILKAIFDKSVKYLLIDAYGPDSFYEQGDKLYFEIGYTYKNYITSWLLSFGDKVKILEPLDIINDIKAITKKITSYYESV